MFISYYLKFRSYLFSETPGGSKYKLRDKQKRQLCLEESFSFSQSPRKKRQALGKLTPNRMLKETELSNMERWQEIPNCPNLIENSRKESAEILTPKHLECFDSTVEWNGKSTLSGDNSLVKASENKCPKTDLRIEHSGIVSLDKQWKILPDNSQESTNLNIEIKLCTNNKMYKSCSSTMPKQNDEKEPSSSPMPKQNDGKEPKMCTTKVLTQSNVADLIEEEINTPGEYVNCEARGKKDCYSSNKVLLSHCKR